MSNLDQLLSSLALITVITFIFERILENLLIPLLPASSQTDPESRVLKPSYLYHPISHLCARLRTSPV